MTARSELDPLGDLPVGTTLIEASAGTGKTHAITSLVVRLVADQGLSLDRILVVTFTRAATEELRDRIRKRLRIALRAFSGGQVDDEFVTELARRRDEARRSEARLRVEAALASLDEATISTIHGFCQRMLQEHAFSSRVLFDAELIEDVRPILDEITDDYWSRELHDAPRALAERLPKNARALMRSLAARAVQLRDARLEFEAQPVRSDEWDAAVAALRNAVRTEGAGLLQTLERARERGALSDAYLPERVRPVWDALRRYVEGARPIPGDLPPDFLAFVPEANPEARPKGSRRQPPDHPVLSAAKALYNLVGRMAYRVIAGIAEEARRELPRRLAARGAMSFDDLLHLLRDALRGEQREDLQTAIRGRISAALIDEFQDTDQVQYEIFSRLFGAPPSRLFLIGDPKQAIYSFRGADVNAYLRASEDARGRVRTLTRNWRSDPSVLAAVKTLFTARRDPFVDGRIVFDDPKEHHPPRIARVGKALAGMRIAFAHPDAVPDAWVKRYRDGRVRIQAGPFAAATPVIVASDIVRTLRSGIEIEGRRLSPGDIAVLVRTNQQARDIQKALGRLRVPAVLHGDSSVFESQEAHDLASVLRAVLEPWNGRLLRAALATDLLGWTAGRLFDLDRDESAWDPLVESFRELNVLWQRRGFAPAFQRLLGNFDVPERRLARAGGERAMTNLRHLAELLQRLSREERLGPAALVERFERLVRADAEYDEIEARQVRLESDADAVDLVTIHRSKGLQYPVVFVPYAYKGEDLRDEEKQFLRYAEPTTKSPALVVRGDARMDHGDQRMRAAFLEHFAEDVRLFYVAVTRARHHVVVYAAATDSYCKTPLAWLAEPPDHTIGSSGRKKQPTAVHRAREHLRSLAPDDYREALESIAADSGGSIEIEDLPRAGEETFERGAPSGRELAARGLSRAVDRHWRAASFSEMTRGESDSFEARDVADPPAEGADAATAGDAPPSGLASLPKGRQTGDLIHGILERVGFTREEQAAWADVIAARLRGFSKLAGCAGPIESALSRLADADIGFDGRPLRLRDVPPSRRIAELEFTLPVCASGEAVLSESLARVFRRHASDAVPPAYADRVAALGFDPLRGFLRGYIDLVVADSEDRFYVIDYKTNHLGLTPGDYDESVLRDNMAEHHYILQYHLYALALHRHLRRTLPAYDPARHFGGAIYLYLRGIDLAGGTGVFRDPIGPAMLEALDGLFETGGSAG